MIRCLFVSVSKVRYNIISHFIPLDEKSRFVVDLESIGGRSHGPPHLSRSRLLMIRLGR
jgi:hypothetical protein